MTIIDGDCHSLVSDTGLRGYTGSVISVRTDNEASSIGGLASVAHQKQLFAQTGILYVMIYS